MSDLAIRVDHLYKQYDLGQSVQHDTLRDQLMYSVRSLVHWSRGERTAKHTFWAINDVSFEVKHGEVLGIIGRNGAGKSTLLKILSRITRPTRGFADIHGRVGSLLEVGTGFHPELSGRENVYLNGAVLGMKKAEIDRKFDEIIAFAEVEDFLDVPVKRYSSGMYVRLAFAVAAHLEPEILIVDEVLAVGDAAFQKKCLGKMGETAKGGRTVLFVTHSMVSIQALCTRALLLKHGTVQYDGEPQQAVTAYLSSMEQVWDRPLDSRADRKGGEILRFSSVQFLNPRTMLPYDLLSSGNPVIIRIGLVNSSPRIVEDVGVGIAFFTATGGHLCGCRSRAVGQVIDCKPGRASVDCIIPRWPLNAGLYSYDLFAERKGNIALDWIQSAGSVSVEAGDYYGTGILPSANHQGIFIDYSYRSSDVCEGA